MKLSSRVANLRKLSLESQESISAERAILMTRYYEESIDENLSIPVRRARAFEYVLKHKSLYIGEAELIVGERGPLPKATPTYPEINLHTLEDLEILSSRDKVAFKVEDEVFDLYRDYIIPFWKGKNNRERIMNTMTPEWHRAYTAGVFTEFQEQRAPGHTVLGPRMYQKGFLRLKEEIREAQEKLNVASNKEDQAKMEELIAMDICCNAIMMFANRYACTLEELAKSEDNVQRRKELEEMAAICRRVPAHPPETVPELLQYYWFIHLGVITELNPWDSFNPGRLDQHLYPIYKRQIENGEITKEEVFEWLCCFWVKFNNHPAPPKVGVTAKESNTYTDFCLINLGGVNPDGTDAVNDMTYLLLNVIKQMRLLQPSSMIQVSFRNPDSLLHEALDIIKTGFGQPSIFNTEAIIRELLNQDKSIVDARNGGASGCVETGAFGTECYWLTGYFNLPKVLELTIYNGIDPITGDRIGLPTGEVSSFNDFASLLSAFKKQLEYFIEIKIEGNRAIETIMADHLPAPFLSTLIEDCIENATDYNAGGARYNTSYIQGVGIGSISDMLTAIRFHIYDKQTFSWEELLGAMEHNFEGFENMQYELIHHTPKYGNNEQYADQHAVDVFHMFYNAVNGKPLARGGVHRINLLPTTSHVYFGSKLKASPDGRGAGMPLSEGISPFQGADYKGPTAVLLSAARLDHARTGGTLLNQKLNPDFFKRKENYGKLTSLIRTYFEMGGHHIQFNVVDADTLRDAQKHPERYRDLIVRVAGYSDYFNDIGQELQDEIIRRTEHMLG